MSLKSGLFITLFQCMYFLCLYSLLCVRPGWKPRLLVFPCEGSGSNEKIRKLTISYMHSQLLLHFYVCMICCLASQATAMVISRCCLHFMGLLPIRKSCMYGLFDLNRTTVSMAGSGLLSCSASPVISFAWRHR